MSKFKTPGVLVEELSKFPPSVAQVETAVPSFIGYTEIANDKGTPLKLMPKKIQSMVDYETFFGTAQKESIELKDTTDKGLTLVKPDVKFLMYYSLQLYFANGGGPCYIISVGDYSGNVNKTDLKKGLDVSALQEESTLVVFPDAVSLTDEEQFYAIYQDALTQAADLKNRFLIMDTYLGESKSKKPLSAGGPQANTIGFLRDRIASNMQAAAYFPHLKTVLNYTFDETAPIVHKGLETTGSPSPFFSAALTELATLKNIAALEVLKDEEDVDMQVLIDVMTGVIATVETVNITADTTIDLATAKACLQTLRDEAAVYPYPDVAAIIGVLETAVGNAEDKKGAASGKSLAALKLSDSALYTQIKKEIDALKVVLPPSSAMAGIYAKTDATQGVWKAPANKGINYVMATTEKISDEEQQSLNVDENGKTINAIRTFTGKGITVWGARTFDSASNEWKYISVRRLFDMVEKSVKNATERFLFEPNEPNTWIKAKAMIENYLNQLWMSGALAGSTPEQAYYVIVGKETTTPQEIQAGVMNIQIGMAAVRPAEFIVLNFSHKLQES